jgi:tRNA-modifying protein YgfZ
MSEQGFAARPGWGFVHVTGADTWPFLQGLVSQDLDPLGDGGGAHSLLLSPQGKLEVDFRILRVGDEAWLDAHDGPGLAAGLERFKIRVDVDITDRSGDRALLAVRGVDADVVGIDLPAAEHSHVEVGGARVVRVRWGDAPGFDVVGPDLVAIEETLEHAGVARLDDATFELLRIEAGVPLGGVDMDTSTIPQEAFLDDDAVSFTKGCFLGQELVCRIDTRGRVTRFLRRVETSDHVPERGAELRDAEGKVVGALTSVAPRPEGGAVGLAMVRREVEPPAELTIGVPYEATVRVLELARRSGP